MKKITIPDIAKGSVVPEYIHQKQFTELKQESDIKSQRKHDWLIAIFNAVSGFIGGIISSLIVMYIKGLL